MPKNKPNPDELRLDRDHGVWCAWFDGWEESGQWYGDTQDEAKEQAMDWLAEQCE